MRSVELIPYTLKFNFTAKTSRNVLKELETVLIKVTDGNCIGWGECCVLPGLSVDESIDYTNYDPETIRKVEHLDLDSCDILKWVDENIPSDHRSMRMGMATALLDLKNGGKRLIFESEFYRGIKSIPINGLIWMGHSEYMLKQISEKISDGFQCIKIKIGGIDFDLECDILDYIRRRYYNKDIVIRLDANGAFKPEEALHKIERLSKYDIHSIEQPIAPGHSKMAEVITNSSIPVALDEELIAAANFDERSDLLDNLNPPFLVLKPSLLGGFNAISQWITLAERHGAGWWITSALESSIGLNAIAQYTSTYDNPLPQGLGTGAIYENNVRSPLVVKQERLYYTPSRTWDLGIHDDK